MCYICPNLWLCGNSDQTLEDWNAKVARVSETSDPLLLTPPVDDITARQVMVHDWGSRDATFLRSITSADAAAEIVNGAGSTLRCDKNRAFAVRRC